MLATNEEKKQKEMEEEKRQSQKDVRRKELPTTRSEEDMRVYRKDASTRHILGQHKEHVDGSLR